MTIHEGQWAEWLSTLEEMLDAADDHSEHVFAIHINSAIETAYARINKDRSGLTVNQ